MTGMIGDIDEATPDDLGALELVASALQELFERLLGFSLESFRLVEVVSSTIPD